jgi:hypothetical protein
MAPLTPQSASNVHASPIPAGFHEKTHKSVIQAYSNIAMETIATKRNITGVSKKV